MFWADAKFAVLADFMKDDSVDGDAIIDAIEVQKSARTAAIEDFFSAKAPVAALGKLAREAHLFL